MDVVTPNWSLLSHQICFRSGTGQSHLIREGWKQLRRVVARGSFHHFVCASWPTPPPTSDISLLGISKNSRFHNLSQKYLHSTSQYHRASFESNLNLWCWKSQLFLLWLHEGQYFPLYVCVCSFNTLFLKNKVFIYLAVFIYLFGCTGS